MPPSHVDRGAPTDSTSTAVDPLEQLHRGKRSAVTAITDGLTLLTLVPYSSSLDRV
jgi:hypothetical protein